MESLIYRHVTQFVNHYDAINFLKGDCMPTEEQQYLLDNKLPDRCVGTVSIGKKGGVIVDGGQVYISDLMREWANIKKKKLTSINTERDVICTNIICAYCINHNDIQCDIDFPNCFEGRKLTAIE